MAYIDSLFSTLGLKSFRLWRILAIFFALLNLKQLPFVWHLRIINGLIQYLPWTSKGRLDPRSIGPSALFRPLILTSRTTPLECDYNLHKSNSTYFADFDIGRMHLLVCLCRSGIVKTGFDLWEKDGRKGPKGLAIMMGGVNINFRREIKPAQAYEMWTRVLAWDRKWIYTVTHFVRKGAVKPRGWLLQPWRNQDKTQTQQQYVGEDERERVVGDGCEKNEKEKRTGTHPAIFATGIAKYVAKRGRLTIPPELILQNTGLLPPKPKDHETPPISETPAVPTEGDALPTSGAAVMQDLNSNNAEEAIDTALNDTASTSERSDRDEWDWDRVERERLRGMEIAEKWNLTEGLSEMFDGDKGTALGRYWDIL
ncbi:MAG: hypothetical protein L6R38_003084 [Xanthoria sp. 2 TBL-2021]|nr:MAG: hypothetical protein L6R38_003084 [Xanthoria sp. 2 TBL-2021]